MSVPSFNAKDFLYPGLLDAWIGKYNNCDNPYHDIAIGINLRFPFVPTPYLYADKYYKKSDPDGNPSFSCGNIYNQWADGAIGEMYNDNSTTQTTVLTEIYSDTRNYAWEIPTEGYSFKQNSEINYEWDSVKSGSQPTQKTNSELGRFCSNPEDCGIDAGQIETSFTISGGNATNEYTVGYNVTSGTNWSSQSNSNWSDSETTTISESLETSAKGELGPLELEAKNTFSWSDSKTMTVGGESGTSEGGDTTKTVVQEDKITWKSAPAGSTLTGSINYTQEKITIPFSVAIDFEMGAGQTMEIYNSNLRLDQRKDSKVLKQPTYLGLSDALARSYKNANTNITPLSSFHEYSKLGEVFTKAAPPTFTNVSGDGGTEVPIYINGNIQGVANTSYKAAYKLVNPEGALIPHTTCVENTEGKCIAASRLARERDQKIQPLGHGKDQPLFKIRVNGKPTKIGVHIDTSKKLHNSHRLIGSDYSDEFNMSAKKLIAHTFGGNDIVNGSDYSDTIHSSGSDTIHSKKGNDRILAKENTGSTFIDAGAGDDLIEVLVSNAGVDDITLGEGADKLKLYINKNIKKGGGFNVRDMGKDDTFRFIGKANDLNAVVKSHNVHYFHKDRLVGTFFDYGDFVLEKVRDATNATNHVEAALLNADKLKNLSSLEGDLLNQGMSYQKGLEEIVALGHELRTNYDELIDNKKDFSNVINAIVDEFVAPKARDAVISQAEEAANSYDSLGQLFTGIDQSLNIAYNK